MSAPMKTHRTKKEVKISIEEKRPRLFLVPGDHVKGIVKLLRSFEISEDEATVSWENAVSDLVKKYGSSGVSLKGARTKEGLTQADLAEKLGITQHEISEMENGRRPIGKKMAKRLSKVLKIDYRIFL